MGGDARRPNARGGDSEQVMVTPTVGGGQPAEHEFDGYAEDYSPSDAGLYGLLGRSPRAYLEVKADHLLRALARTQLAPSDQKVRFLDFGCGAADFLAVLRDRSVAWSMEGCDVSSGMLRTAAERHPELSPEVRLWNCAEGAFPESAYDLITVVSVLHHVPPPELRDTLSRLWRALAPGGALCVYEHNPWNPVTRFMVARIPIDRNAVLISQPDLASHLSAVGASDPWLSNLLFFPPRLGFARRVEGVLERIPLGGQYLMMTCKPA